jgi:hypothetical protein
MRYINQWKGQVVVPEYTQDVSSSVMATLKNIPGCDDPVAQVCKQDSHTLLVRAQHLNDTKVMPINSQLAVKSGDKLEIGLIQGFLTLPMDKSTPSFLWSYVDLDYRIGYRRNYANKSTLPVDPYINLNSPGKHLGIYDNHQGIDYNMAIGSPLLE